MLIKTTRLSVILTVIVLLAAVIVGCETPFEYELRTERLIYEMEWDNNMDYITLVDVSLDGTLYILVARYIETEVWTMWYLEPASTEPVLITDDTGLSWFGNSTLSPNQENIVFSTSSGIYVIPLTGGEPKMIYRGVLDPEVMSWKDNETVYVYDFNANPFVSGYEVKSININTLETEVIIEIVKPDDFWSFNIDGAWISPVNGELAVTGMYNYEEFGLPTFFLRIYNSEMTGYKVFTNCELFPNRPWSPDGTKIGLGWCDELGYFDVADGKYVSVWRSNELQFYTSAGDWLGDSRTMLASENRDDNILRVYAVSVE